MADGAPVIDYSDPNFDTRSWDQEQRPLFPTEELIVPQSLKTLRKAVAAIHAVPVNAEHKMTLNVRRIQDAIYTAVQLDFRARERPQVERIIAERICPVFEIRVGELAKIANIPGKNYIRIYGGLDILFDTAFHWNVVGEDDSVEWQMKSRLFVSLGYGKNSKDGYVRFSIAPEVLAFILEPSVWASLSTGALKKLKSETSYSLFQNTWRYLNTRARMTAPLPTATWIELLMGKSRYVVGDQAEGKVVVDYGDFKRRYLADAMRRVNECPALGHELELIEHRSGKRVVKLQFRLVPKKQASLSLPLTWPSELFVVLENIGYSREDIVLLAESYSYDLVADALVRYKESETRIREKGERIHDRRYYFEGILRNIGKVNAEDTANSALIEKEARKFEQECRAQERHDRMEQEFARHQHDKFGEFLFGLLGEEERNDLFGRFEASAEGKKVRLILKNKRMTQETTVAIGFLRRWVSKERPDLMEKALPNPEDKTIEQWMAWKLDPDR